MNAPAAEPGGQAARVSVIMPLYRPGPGLAHALERLAATVGEHDEVLVVDDGTPPPVAGELASLVREHLPGAFLLVRPSNGGVAAARNDALRHATGRYVWFVDWDDGWDPGILDVLVTRAEAERADVATCRADVVDDRGRLVRRISPAHDLTLRGRQNGQALLDGRLEGHLWNKLLRRRVLPDQPFPLVPTHSDLLGIAPVLAGADRIVHVGEVLYQHRTRPGSLTSAPDRDLSVLLSAGRTVPAVVAPLLGASRETALLGTLFRHRSAYLTAVTALRLSTDARYRDGWVQRSREQVTWSEAVTLLGRSPSTAARSLALLGLGRAFEHCHGAGAALRDRLRPRAADPSVRQG